MKELLMDLEYELISRPAWSGHEFAFIFLAKYYNRIRDYMISVAIDSQPLVDAYLAAEREYNEVTGDEFCSFTKLDKLDNHFVDCLSSAADLIAKSLGIKLNYLGD